MSMPICPPGERFYEWYNRNKDELDAAFSMFPAPNDHNGHRSSSRERTPSSRSSSVTPWSPPGLCEAKRAVPRNPKLDDTPIGIIAAGSRSTVFCRKSLLISYAAIAILVGGFWWALFQGQSMSLPSIAKFQDSHSTHSVHLRSSRHKVNEWLRDNSNDGHAFEYLKDQKPLRQQLFSGQNLLQALGLSSIKSSRPKAAIISLVRNEELDGIVQSMRQLEMRWNWKYRYPWVFLSESEFSEDFKVCQRHHKPLIWSIL